MTTVTIEYDCGAVYRIPTTVPAAGSALHHAITIDTLAALAEVQHATEHPDCGNGPNPEDTR